MPKNSSVGAGRHEQLILACRQPDGSIATVFDPVRVPVEGVPSPQPGDAVIPDRPGDAVIPDRPVAFVGPASRRRRGRRAS